MCAGYYEQKINYTWPKSHVVRVKQHHLFGHGYHVQKNNAQFEHYTELNIISHDHV